MLMYVFVQNHVDIGLQVTCSCCSFTSDFNRKSEVDVDGWISSSVSLGIASLSVSLQSLLADFNTVRIQYFSCMWRCDTDILNCIVDAAFNSMQLI